MILQPSVNLVKKIAFLMKQCFLIFLNFNYSDSCDDYTRCHNLPNNLGYKCSCTLGMTGSRCDQGEFLPFFIPEHFICSFSALARLWGTPNAFAGVIKRDVPISSIFQSNCLQVCK